MYCPEESILHYWCYYRY